MEKRASSLISAFVKSGKVTGKDFSVRQADQDELEQELAKILQQANALGKQYGLAMVERQERAISIKDTVIGTGIYLFLKRAKDVVVGIVQRVRDVISNSNATPEDAQEAMDSLFDSLPDTVATTEVHTEVEQAIADVFSEQGVELVEWITELGACDLCAINEDQGPIKQGTAFASGDMAPPAHPRCRCNVVPSAIEEQGS